MIKVEFSIYPFVEGEVPPSHVQAAIEALTKAGLKVDVGPLSSSVAGESEPVLEALRHAQLAAISAGAQKFVVMIESIGTP